MNKLDVVRELNFGRRVAEEEVDELARYFVETDQWRRIYSGEVDIVYGAKGAGKSAIYSLLIAKSGELIAKGVLTIPAENLRGAPAFENLVTDPPANEQQFVDLWKLYFLSLIGSQFQENNVAGEAAQKVVAELERAGLLQRDRTLKSLLSAITSYVKQIVPRINSIDFGTMDVDQVTGNVAGGSLARITLREPTTLQANHGFISVDDLLSLANDALAVWGFEIWLLLDRLDVAFSEKDELEENALRALFRVYRDFSGYTRLHMKIFLRTDIWKRITRKGFREASHITRDTTLTWDENSLLNLTVSRILSSNVVSTFYNVDPQAVLRSIEEQQKLVYRIFPDQIDVGQNNPPAFRWMVNRVKDGTNYPAPRELIHLLNAVRDEQIRRLERGEVEPEGERLFTRPVFKDALSEVSRDRLNRTLYAEYPSLQQYLEKLRGGKTEQYPATLAAIWEVSQLQANQIAEELIDVGFFVRRGERENISYWIPFLYRDGLEMVQGAADSE